MARKSDATTVTSAAEKTRSAPKPDPLMAMNALAGDTDGGWGGGTRYAKGRPRECAYAGTHARTDAHDVGARTWPVARSTASVAAAT